MLLTTGASFDVKDKSGKTPLDLCPLGPAITFLKEIRQIFHGIQENDSKVMMIITHPENLRVVVKLCDRNGDTLLHYAAIANCIEVTQFLLINGAPYNSRNNAGSTADRIALKHGHYDVNRILVFLEQLFKWEENLIITLREAEESAVLLKIIINARDCEEKTILHNAVNGHGYRLKYLLQHGANINAKDSTRCSVIESAASRNEWDVVKLLIQYGVDRKFLTSTSFELVEKAARAGRGDIVRILKS